MRALRSPWWLSYEPGSMPDELELQKLLVVDAESVLRDRLEEDNPGEDSLESVDSPPRIRFIDLS